MSCSASRSSAASGLSTPMLREYRLWCQTPRDVHLIDTLALHGHTSNQPPRRDPAGLDTLDMIQEHELARENLLRLSDWSVRTRTELERVDEGMKESAKKKRMTCRQRRSRPPLGTAMP